MDSHLLKIPFFPYPLAELPLSYMKDLPLCDGFLSLLFVCIGLTCLSAPAPHSLNNGNCDGPCYMGEVLPPFSFPRVPFHTHFRVTVGF